MALMQYGPTTPLGAVAVVATVPVTGDADPTTAECRPIRTSDAKRTVASARCRAGYPGCGLSLSPLALFAPVVRLREVRGEKAGDWQCGQQVHEAATSTRNDKHCGETIVVIGRHGFSLDALR
jgi:hypothetical protein